MARKKILIVAESIDVEDSSGTKGRVALIRNLHNLGYQLRVYHYTRKEIYIDDIECISLKENRRSILFFLSRLERYLRYVLKINLYRPLENLFGFSFTLLNDRKSIINGLRNAGDWNPDLVITLSKGGSFRPHHALAHMEKFHPIWLAYIHDPYPMHWYPPPYPWFEPGYRQKELFMKNLADKAKYVGFPSQLLKEWMGSKYEPFKEKGIVIPHQINNDLTEISIAENDSFEYMNPGNFNIVHAGNLIQGREPFGLLEGFKKFIDLNPEAGKKARLIFLGGKNYYSELLETSAREIPQIIVSDNKLEFEEVRKLQDNASVNIILEAKSAISPFLPGKFPHCVIANRKILLLGPPLSESRRLLGEDYDFWAEIDDTYRISELLQKLFVLWEENPDNLNLNRNDLELYLSDKKLYSVINSVVTKG